MSWHIGTRILAIVAIGLMSASPSWARIGVASAVDGEPKGLPPAGTERILHIGNDMEPNERVTTGANDKAQIVFLDGSSLTVGPNSVLTIDKFVYDPERKTGELALNASRGVFRFVGGAISKSSEVTIKTPSATMGIRGGIATFAVAANGNTTANLLVGASLTVTSGGVTQTTTQAGTQITAPMGLPPTPPAPMPAGGGLGVANAFQNSGPGQPGQQGGGGPGNAPGTPGFRPGGAAIGAAFANSGLSRANSAIPPTTALANVPATQQAQLKTAAPTAPAGPQQAAGPQQGTGPQLASNPLQGANPLLGASPLQVANPLQGTNPLQSSNPLQGTNPLQGSNPLQGAAPIQAVGPLPPPTQLAAVPPPPAGPFVAPPPPVGPVGPVGTIPILLNGLFAGPNPPSPEILAILVSVLSPPPPSDPPPPPTPPIPVSNPPPTPPTPPQPPIITPPPPISLPPPVFNPTCQSQLTPSQC